ncbi:MAG: NTP transferase domain-containing protein [Clostridiales bacterium]|nr:NTP transferase domain-containing protein [Clostridiales bacterium]
MNGAIIAAAGMTSGEEGFRPIMQIGSITMIERIIGTFQAAKVDLIVVVTGNRAKEIENKMRFQGIIFLRNADYEHTQMLDSAKVGLEYLKDKCDKILFTPADVPFFHTKTIVDLLKTEDDIVIPTYNGAEGHPLLIKSRVIEEIIGYDGSDGLRGAALHSRYQVKHMAVNDDGILLDVDRLDDYEETLEMHSKQLFRPEIRVRLLKEKPFFDPVIAQLLKQIQYTGSMRYACQRLNLSYSKGWNMVNNAEQQLGIRIIVRHQGGLDGGYTIVSEQGRELLSRYEEYQREIMSFAEEKFTQYFGYHDI